MFELRTDKSKGQRAVNKPVMVLWMLGRFYNNGMTTFDFSELESPLSNLIREYTNRDNVADPYWRLRNDGVLGFPFEEKIRTDRSGGAFLPDLREFGSATFTQKFLDYISVPENLVSYCETILEKYFTDSLSDDILQQVGLTYRYEDGVIPMGDGFLISKRRKRNPQFREDIAIAYNHQCAVCGFSLLMGSLSVGNEAAHIQWHAYNGPDDINNGLFLCSLHHKLFDHGVIGLDESYRVIISSRASSTSQAFRQWIIDYDRESINLPRQEIHHPKPEYVNWHRIQVFVS